MLSKSPALSSSEAGGSRIQWPALAFLIAWLLGSNAAWLFLDQRPTDMDQGRYMMMVRDFANGWERLDGMTMKSVLFGNHPSHPHLVPLLASVPFALFDRRSDAAYFVNTLFHVGVVALVFLTGRLLGGPAVGLLAALLAAGFPLLSRFSRLFLLEEAAAFFTVTTLYCLLRTEGFSSARWSALTGLALGLGLLTKWTVLVFTAPALVWLAIASLLERRDAKLFTCLAALVGASAMVAAPWYVSHAQPLMSFFVYAEQGLLFAGEERGTSQFFYYLRAFWATAGWPLTLLSLMGVAYAALRRTAELLAILLSGMVPLLIFSFLLSTRDVRHLIPALPALLLMTSLAVGSLRPAFLRKGFIVATGVTSCLSAVQATWGLPGWRSELTLGSWSSLVLPEARPPDTRDWRFDELLAKAAEDALVSSIGGAPAEVRVLSANLPFRTNGFVFLAAERFPSLQVVHLPFYIPAGRPGHRHLDAEALVSGGYLLQREGDVNANRTGMFDYSRALYKYLEGSLGADGGLFKVIYSTTLPGGHAARVVRARPYRCDAALLQFLDWADEVDPDDPSVLRLLSVCEARGEEGGLWRELAKAKRSEASDSGRESTLGSLVDRHPSLRWPRRLLAETLRSDARYPEAAAAYASIGRGSPYLCSPFLLAGDCWREMGAVAAATEAYKTAVADSPDCVRAHRELSVILRGLGLREAARREERKVQLLRRQAGLGQNVDSARYRLLLGDLALAASETSEAMHHYRAGLRNDPKNDEVSLRIRSLDAGAPAGRE